MLAPRVRSIPLPAVVMLAPPPVIFKPVPEVAALLEIDSEIPVKAAVLLVIMAIVPAVEPEDVRSRRVPCVVFVSTEEEERRSNDPPVAITEVVCGILIAVPVVRPLAVMLMSPVPV